MASPYDAAIDMFDLPRYQGLQGSFTLPRRQDPAADARRSFLEGGRPAPEDEEWAIASQSPDPMGVMEELRKVREERDTEDLIGSIAELDPAAKDYLTKVRGTLAGNPKAFSNPAVGRILEFQNRMMPPKVPAPTFQYPQFQSKYQQLVGSGADPQAAANEVQMAEQQYGLQRQLASSGLPFDNPELMTDNRLDELKVLQQLARAKEASKVKGPQFRVPTELSEALQDAFLSGDQEQVNEARNAINNYQQEWQQIMGTKAVPQTVPQVAPADLKRVDVPPVAEAPPEVPRGTSVEMPKPSGQNLAAKPSEDELKATAIAVAPQRLSVPAQAALKALGVDKLMEFYMAKTPENPTNPGDVKTASEERKSMEEELLKEWKGDPSALTEAADLINELMGPYGYKTRMEIDRQPRFVNAQGTQAPVIKAIRLKAS